MTDFTRYKSRTRDIQDYVERGVYGSWTEVPGAGAMLSVRGTGTLDEEVPIMHFGYSFRLPDNSNAEVVMLSLGSDVNDKVALPTLPRDRQHPWGVGQGGVQHPTDPSRRLEYNGDETWLKDGNYKLGNNKEVEVIVAGGAVTINIGPDATINVPNLTINSDVAIQGTLDVNGSSVQHNGINIGDTHTHPGVDSGPNSTGGPQ